MEKKNLGYKRWGQREMRELFLYVFK